MNVSQGSSDLRALRLSREMPAQTSSGYGMLLVVLLAIIAIGGGLAVTASGARLLGVLIMGGSLLVGLFVACGFYFLQPNQAAAILLFGDYRGTDRTTGLRWCLP